MPPSEQPPGWPVLTGVVKFFHAEKGYGFIVPDSGGDDVFVHRKCSGSLDDTAYLEKGQHVQFEKKWFARKGKWSASSCTGFNVHVHGNVGDGPFEPSEEWPEEEDETMQEEEEVDSETVQEEERKLEPSAKKRLKPAPTVLLVEDFDPGQRVKIIDLKATFEYLNGLAGTCVRIDDSRRRWHVLLDGHEKNKIFFMRNLEPTHSSTLIRPRHPLKPVAKPLSQPSHGASASPSELAKERAAMLSEEESRSRSRSRHARHKRRDKARSVRSPSSSHSDKEAFVAACAAPSFQPRVSFEFDAGTGMKARWEPYDTVADAIITQAWRKRSESCRFMVGGKWTYTVDFVRMVQRSEATGKERPLRLRPPREPPPPT